MQEMMDAIQEPAAELLRLAFSRAFRSGWAGTCHSVGSSWEVPAT